MKIEEMFLAKARENGFINLGNVEVGELEFEQSLQDMCKQNVCGHYDTNWACPPACGSSEELKKKILSYEHGIVLQKVYELEDSFDFEGMMQAVSEFTKSFNNLLVYLNDNAVDGYDALKAGCCEICDECSYPDSPCKHPSICRPSLEACGINVSSLCKMCDIPYINGKNTVTYTGMFLFRNS